MRYQLRVFESDATVIADLRAAFRGTTAVVVEYVSPRPHFEPPAGIDVLYMPLMAAERFGSKPLVHESMVLPTTAEAQRQGLPPYVVTGTCLSPDEPRGPIPEMRILLTAVAAALRAFNQHEAVKLERVGFWADDLLTGLTAVQLRGLLSDVFPELRLGQS